MNLFPGTFGNDTLIGKNLDDLLIGLFGNDRLIGLGGNEKVTYTYGDAEAYTVGFSRTPTLASDTR